MYNIDMLDILKVLDWELKKGEYLSFIDNSITFLNRKDNKITKYSCTYPNLSIKVYKIQENTIRIDLTTLKG